MGNRLLVALLAFPLIAADLRIGVLSLFRPERITVRSTEMLWVQAGSRTFFLTPGQVAGLRAVGAEVDLFAQQQLSSSPRVSIGGRGGASAVFSLTIEGKIDRKFRGRLEVTAIGARLEPVILVDAESAVAAAVAAEMPAGTPPEALKAMAVLVRSYYAFSGRRHGPYDFCDTTHCQWRRESIAELAPSNSGGAGDLWDRDDLPRPALCCRCTMPPAADRPKVLSTWDSSGSISVLPGELSAPGGKRIPEVEQPASCGHRSALPGDVIRISAVEDCSPTRVETRCRATTIARGRRW